MRIEAGVEGMERRAVIMMNQMRDFMRHDIIAHERRGEHQPPAIGNTRGLSGARRGTTAPAAAP